MHRRRRAGQLLHTPVPDSGARGQRLLPPVIGRSPILPPWGSLCPSAGSATNFADEGKEREVADTPARSQVAGPGGPATVPGRRAAPLEGRRGGGHRRSYTRLTPDSRLGRPPSLSLTCLAPPPARSAPSLGLALRAPGRRYARDRRYRPLGPGLVFSLVSPRVRTAPSAPPSQVPAPPPVSGGSRARSYWPSMAPGCLPSSHLPGLSPAPGRGRSSLPGTAVPEPAST